MTAVDIVKRVIAANFLSESLTYIPESGASPSELDYVESKLRRSLSRQHRSFLERWNGINLDVVRIYGASPVKNELKGVLEIQEIIDAEPEQGIVAFGESPAGFIYLEDGNGNILMLDLDGGDVEIVASSIDDFFVRLIFGPDAANFAGKDWYDELRRNGLF